MTELAFIVAGIAMGNDLPALLLICAVLLAIGLSMMAFGSERATRNRRAREYARQRAKREAKYWAKRGVQVAYREPFFAYRRNNKMRFLSLGRLRISWVMTKRKPPIANGKWAMPVTINGNDEHPSWQAWR